MERSGSSVQDGSKEKVKKPRMKTSSCKQKGRVLQQWTCAEISKITGYSWGHDEPIESRGMGQNGVDVRMESAVQKLFPFSVECKNCESWSVHSWIEQSKANQKEGTDWLIVAKRNRGKPVVVIDAEVFFALMEKVIGK
ncbi:MAG: hypothetical protein M0R51_13445 [Clostridia bacterium]|jgi:hypothetical protein|nr:hypothetical protein [Clostridia bacterium]